MSGSPSVPVSAQGLDRAAQLVSVLYDALGRPDLAGMIRDGKADDFPEIGTAASLLEAEAQRVARYEIALRQYADPDFWDGIGTAAPLAVYDGGEMARNVLAGRPAFYHRD
jgi:hypothetical protein